MAAHHAARGSGARHSAGAPASIPPHAFVTMLTTDAYLPGALVLAHSLRAHNPAFAPSPTASTSSKPVSASAGTPRYHLVCLCTPSQLRVQSIKALRQAFDVVIGVEPLSFAGILRDRAEAERKAVHANKELEAGSGIGSAAEGRRKEKSRVRELATKNLALLGEFRSLRSLTRSSFR